MEQALEIANRAIKVALDKQASDIVLLDTREVCSFVDYFIICSGESERQIEAIRQAIDKTLKEETLASYRFEGTANSGWVLLDCGDVIIHIFAPFEREYYQLDSLWDKARILLRIQ
jgi:ribosome-associated protein